MTHKYILASQTNVNCGLMYLLPKIHKLPFDIINGLEMIENKLSIQIKGRPIISQCQSPTRGISKLLDYFLLPIVKRQDSYIKDTTHFIQKIESLKCESNVLLCTYDITSMYTNMGITELIESVGRALDDINPTDYNLHIVEKDILLTICELVLRNNQFEFNNEFYIQKVGCAMGAIPSPQICNIRAHEVINSIINKYSHKDKIVFHVRYQDDGLILLKDASENDFKEFFEIANAEHELLKFTYEISNSSVNYLDTIVFKGKRFQTRNILDIKSYTKPTETYQYVHRSSAHPPSTFKSLVKGETLRHFRINNNLEDFIKRVKLFKCKLIERGYYPSEIDMAIKYATVNDRYDLLNKREKQMPKQSPLTFVTKYHPSIKMLSKILRKYWSSIEKDDEAKALFPRPPVIAYKRNRNIGDIIVSSKVKNANSNS